MVHSRVFHLAIILLILQSTISNSVTQPVIKDGRYYNAEHDTYEHINLFKAIKFMLLNTLSPSKWQKRLQALVGAKSEMPVFSSHMPEPIQDTIMSQLDPHITWIGHASFLIQVGGYNILTDPIFGDVKAGPLTLVKRAIKPGIKLEELPQIDYILISHNHSDHLDTDCLTALAKRNKRTVVLVPKGNKDLIVSMGFDPEYVFECMWGETFDLPILSENISFTFLPAWHWSIRFSMSSYRASLWGSWMITHQQHDHGNERKETNIFFAGDTAYGQHFKEIAQQFPSIDVALMPIAPTEKDGHEGNNKNGEYHVDAHEALQAFDDLNAQLFVPMHYGTFNWGPTHLQYPLDHLINAWDVKKEQLKDKQLLVAQCGKQYPLK